MTWLYTVEYGDLNVETSMESLQKTKNKIQQSYSWAYIQCGLCVWCVCGVCGVNVWGMCGVCVMCVWCMCVVCVCMCVFMYTYV